MVLDPFTNPRELALHSKGEVLGAIKREPGMTEKFRAAFPDEPGGPTLNQVGRALATFIRSFQTGTSDYDRALENHVSLEGEAERGRALFNGVAACNECHTTTGSIPRFSDGQFHHSGIGQIGQAQRLAELAQTVVEENLDADALGPKVLSDPDWSNLGRFVVTHRPTDIGAFRTPSLRNVAVTAPYMHDGSIATLAEAVDHEIYYRGLSKGHPVNLSPAERRALVSFLESLTDLNYTEKKAGAPAR